MVRMLRWLSISVLALSHALLAAGLTQASFSTAPAQVERFDYVEIIASVRMAKASNPFTDASLSGTFETTDGSRHWSIEGFADSDDGSVFRIRFMPVAAGEYKYTVTYRQGDFEKRQPAHFRQSKRIAAESSPSIPPIPGISSGRNRRALLFQWHHRLLAHGLEG